MIQTYSSTIRRKEMDAVLTCMVDEKIGPGELNARLIQQVKEFFKCDGAVALRSPAVALKYILLSLDLEKSSKIMISALAPAWHYQVIESLGYQPLVLDVQEADALVGVEDIQKGIQNGGRLLLLHETEGILPDFEAILGLGIPVVEDISQSAGASLAIKDENGNPTEERKKAGLFGLYTILGLEERDVITAGGGAVLMAPGRREWIVLKKYTDEAPLADLLPDINSALAWVQLKEFARNEATRREIFSMYQHSCMIGRHKTFARDTEGGSSMCSFPLILNSSLSAITEPSKARLISISFLAV